MPRAKHRLFLALSLPYLAVLVGWIGADSGWLALLLYHAGIVGLSLLEPLSDRRNDRRSLQRGGTSREIASLGLALLAAGLVFSLLLSSFLRPEIEAASWLAGKGVAGGQAWALALYYGIVHPVLEEIHFGPLRTEGGKSRRFLVHVAFAGYHLLVVGALFRPIWTGALFAGLLGVSWLWGEMERRTGGRRPALVFHAAADLVVAVTILRLAGLLGPLGLLGRFH